MLRKLPRAQARHRLSDRLSCLVQALDALDGLLHGTRTASLSVYDLIGQNVICVKPTQTMPNLPVARVMWKPMPNLITGSECWIIAGGAHHTVLSYDISVETLRDFARIMGIEFVNIDANTTPAALEKELMLGEVIWK